VPGEESIVLTSPDVAFVRIAATELNPRLRAGPSARRRHRPGGAVPPFAAPIIAERHCMLGCAQRSHLCTIELGRRYTRADLDRYVVGDR
jgi:hypothetical protein